MRAIRRRPTSAPTPLARQTCPRSASRPSDTSMQACAMSLSTRPNAMRGVGRSRRERSPASRTAPSRHWRSAAAASPARAADPHIVADARTVAPQRAPRVDEAVRGDADRERSARGVAADQRDIRDAWPVPGSRRGSHRPSAHHRRAATATACTTPARRPSRPDRTGSPPAPSSRCRPGAVSSGKCTPALSVSMATTSCRADGTCSNAASSPMPRITSARVRTRARIRSMRSNSAAPRWPFSHVSLQRHGAC